MSKRPPLGLCFLSQKNRPKKPTGSPLNSKTQQQQQQDVRLFSSAKEQEGLEARADLFAIVRATERLVAEGAHPIVIERPIVVNNGKAAIGRPPENVLKIL